MLSRRTFVGAGAATLAAPVLLGRALPRSDAATPPTLDIHLVNNTGNATAYAYVVGIDPAQQRWMFLQADGRTRYYPESPPAPGAPLAVNCSIPLSGPGGSRAVTIPHLVSVRVYFSVGRELVFLLNPGPGIVMPSVANPSDPNINTSWGFCELTYDTTQLYANITFVDFVSIPIGLRLTTPQGVQTAPGLPNGGLATVADALRSQGGDWAKLIRTDGSGRTLRALSPSLGGPDLFQGYLQSYVDETWAKYESTDLTIDTQFTWGVRTGRVRGGELVFDGAGSFGKPSSHAIFNCSLPPFTTGNDLMGNLSARLAAALNRTTLRDNPDQPDTSSSAFYAQPRTNHYARIVHETVPDGRGYAFPYDDVHRGPGDFEGKVQSGQPGEFTITAGTL
jgi:Beta-1,3-glucanase